MSPYGFHPEAAKEFTEAIGFYAEINPRLAEEFLAEIEHSITVVCRNPERWRVVDGDVRRCLLHRYPAMELLRPSLNDLTGFAVESFGNEGGIKKIFPCNLARGMVDTCRRFCVLGHSDFISIPTKAMSLLIFMFGPRTETVNSGWSRLFFWQIIVA